MQPFQLVIPTHARPHRQITLEQLPTSLREQTLVVTSTVEDRVAIGQRYGHKEFAVAKGTNSIAQKRHWIMRNVRAAFIFMMDDDMTFFTRCAEHYRVYSGEWKLRKPCNNFFLNKSTPRDLCNAFDVMAKMAKASRTIAGIGMASRMGNNRVEPAWLHNTRMMHAFGVNTAAYKDLRLNFAEVACREDFNITLRLLMAGFSNAVYFDTCCSPGSYNAAGGASTERTVEQSNAEALRLAAMYPGLVRVVDKPYTSSLPRKEVVIAWKKAAQRGSGKAATE